MKTVPLAGALSMLIAGLLTAAPPDAVDRAVRTVRTFNFDALRLAITDLHSTFGAKYPKSEEYLGQLKALARARDSLLESASPPAAEMVKLAAQMEQLRSEALLSNPLLDFDRLLLVKRASPQGSGRGRTRRNAFGSGLYTAYGANEAYLALPVNHFSLFSVPPGGHDNEIAVLSSLGKNARIETLFRPAHGEYVGDIDLHFDADRLLFTMANQGRYQVFEMRTDGSGLRQVSPSEPSDVDSYIASYLPSERIIFCSTASYQSVPCWNGLMPVASIYTMKADGSDIRQLTFDQDDDSYPTVLGTGQVLFNRWQYTNTPHVFGHMLFQMNPDGTGQREFYGSNSYWPNSVYFARGIPGNPGKVVGIVSGHHGDARMGELVIFDLSKGRREAEGVVQRIPGYGRKVPAIIKDNLTSASWPKFLNPYPLSDKYFLVSAKVSPEAEWSIYLADVFDNLLRIAGQEGFALLEPTPLRKTARPPVIPDTVDRARKDGLVYLDDVYAGPGLAGVPRDAVKRLRVYSYHFAYRGVGGWEKVGIDGPWDVMRILGTVPVDADGSALFRVPANMPIAVQPLDSRGRALQVMRAWFTVMPGEVRSCGGCHESQNTIPRVHRTSAAIRQPSEIQPWYGPARGFDFQREVQPVLDRYCTGCHNGKNSKPDLRPAKHFPDYRGIPVNVPAWWSDHNPIDWAPDLMRSSARKVMNVRFTPAYEALHPYVRRPGLESDYHLPFAAEYHASTSELIQMLEKGHHNVHLDAEAWDRLVTWIDLNAPCHGTWDAVLPIPFNGVNRRRELLRQYAGMDYDPETMPPVATAAPDPIIPPESGGPAQNLHFPGWPFDIHEARERQRAGGFPVERTIHLPDGAEVKLSLIPAGEFVMGDVVGEADERPLTRVRIGKPFWMGVFEITNELFRQFDPSHDSGYINQLNTNWASRGYSVNRPEQPVVRVSWQQAKAFCRWLSGKTGEEFRLPTEAEWEYACRAGTATPLYYGNVSTGFQAWGNMADASLQQFAMDARIRGPLYEMQPDWMLKIPAVNDGAMVTTRVGSYTPNAWGLYDMHGNAGEWTYSDYRPYPYSEQTGMSRSGADKVVRGGSWYDRPQRCRSAFRLHYPAWQRVYNVGFRVVVPVADPR